MLPNVNQIIHISLDNEENYQYKARVADISKENINIELPIDEETGRIKLLLTGSTIMVWYISNEQGQFSFATKVLGLKREQVPLLILEKPVNYQRVQRRDFLRVPVTIETAYKIKISKQKEWNVLKTVDLSGGGMQFILPFPIELAEGEVIEGWIVLPFRNGMIDHIKYEGEILRIQLPHEKAKVNWVSVRFTDIQEKDRAKIIRFCYEKQVDLKKKRES